MFQFPEYVTFEIRPRTDDPKIKQFRADKVLPDGRNLMLVIDTSCRVNPPLGFAVRVQPGRVLFEGVRNILATVFYEKAEEKKAETTPKVRHFSARFVGEAVQMDPEKAERILKGKNVLHSLSELPQSKVVPTSKNKKGKGKDNKKQERKQQRSRQYATA